MPPLPHLVGRPKSSIHRISEQNARDRIATLPYVHQCTPHQLSLKTPISHSLDYTVGYHFDAYCD